MEMEVMKKRAETWGREETRVLISLRQKIDSSFNTSKSNKHLWNHISIKLKHLGFDRSPTMCTDKWRNLLKHFKKIKKIHNHHININHNNKMLFYKELNELICSDTGVGTNSNTNIINNNTIINSSPPHTNIAASKLNLFFHFSDDNGLGDGNIPFGSGEANPGSTVDIERNLGPTVDIERNFEQDDDPLALAPADAANSVPPWNWRDNPEDGDDRNIEYEGRVITVKWGVDVRKIGIDGTREAIKEAIKSTFRLRTNRAFWLEDEFNVTRSFDRSMPLGEYTLHVDEGITIKLCHYDETDHMVVRTVETNLYTEDHFREFLSRSGYIGLREINEYKTFDNLGDLRHGSTYQGVRR